jgi:hypothetical protein
VPGQVSAASGNSGQAAPLLREILVVPGRRMFHVKHPGLGSSGTDTQVRRGRALIGQPQDNGCGHGRPNPPGPTPLSQRPDPRVNAGLPWSRTDRSPWIQVNPAPGRDEPEARRDCSRVIRIARPVNRGPKAHPRSARGRGCRRVPIPTRRRPGFGCDRGGWPIRRRQRRKWSTAWLGAGWWHWGNRRDST